MASVELDDIVERLNEDMGLWENTSLSDCAAQLQKWVTVLSE